MDLQVLETNRLQLDPLTASNADLLFALFQDPDLHRYTIRDVPQSLEIFKEGCRFLEGRLSRDQTEYWLNWISVHKNTHQIVGKIEVTLNRSTLCAYLAYYTFQEHWKKGYAREACLEVIEHLFQVWSAKKIVIEMDTRNQASIRLAESLGAKREGHKKNAEFFKGTWSDEYCYEIVPSRS